MLRISFKFPSQITFPLSFSSCRFFMATTSLFNASSTTFLFLVSLLRFITLELGCKNIKTHRHWSVVFEHAGLFAASYEGAIRDHGL
jgi:hypothetical protein